MYKGKNNIASMVMREMKGVNTPEISQVTPADHLNYFKDHPATKPQTTVWVNGCFDVIHAGHIEMLKYARSVGNRLVVGLDTDDRVRESKGMDRPINSSQHRKTVMEAIRYVDEVVLFGSDDALRNAITWSQADIIVVGEEYTGRVIGEELVREIKYFPRMHNLSTTNIVS
jgi:rfaE bifunctional protein nucleotidyltransferase chain/domain